MYMCLWQAGITKMTNCDFPSLALALYVFVSLMGNIMVLSGWRDRKVVEGRGWWMNAVGL